MGPYIWHEFRPLDIANDITAMRAMGLGHVRVMLSWDVFMPTHRGVDRARLRDFEALLDICAVHGVRVIPVLFAQSIGDTIQLPAYATDVRAPRRGVRVVSGGVVQVGGPRDIWADPLMLEVQHLWLEAMLGAFARHPMVAAWDLGHDPARTVRPRRTTHVAAWLDTFAGRVRDSGDQVWLTVDADDVLGSRALRLADVASRVDALGLQLFPNRLGIARDGDPVSAAAFTVQLAQRQCGSATDAAGACPVVVHTGIPTGVGEPAPSDAGGVLEAVADVGAAGAFAWSWSDWGPRPAGAAPADHQPGLGHLGLVDERGSGKPVASAWRQAAKADRAVAAAQPWPVNLNHVDYLANLPESARELYAQWRGQPR